MFTNSTYTRIRFVCLSFILLFLVGCISEQSAPSTVVTLSAAPAQAVMSPAKTSPTSTSTTSETTEPESQDTQLEITYPTEGMILSGTVALQGTVIHPNLTTYGIVYTTDAYHTADSAWRVDEPLVWNADHTVTNDILGEWDTTNYPNGSYSLLLVVYEMGSETPLSYFVDNLTIQNEPKPTGIPSPIPPSPTAFPVTSTVALKDLNGFALGGHIHHDSSDEYFDRMRYAGMTWVKYQINYVSSADAEQITHYHDQGFKIQLTAFGSPDMVREETFVEDYVTWVASLAASGADAIEIWSEPNIDRFWAAGDIDPTTYTQLLCAAYDAIKQANPQTSVISAAPAPTGYFGGCNALGCDDQPWMEALYAAGAAECMDYIGAHHNAGATSPSARIGHPANVGDTHHSWFFLPQTELYYQIFEGRKQLFYTEMGYASQEGVPPFSAQFAWASGTDNAQQAAWLAEAAQLSVNTGMVHAIMVWNVNFTRYGYDPQDGYAIIRPDGSCPACATLREVMVEK